MWTFNSLQDVLQKGVTIVAGSPAGFMNPFTGGGANPYAAVVAIEDDEKSFNVVSLVKINGFVFGMFQMSTSPIPYAHSLRNGTFGNHAEDGFISAYEEFLNTPFFAAMWYATTQSQIGFNWQSRKMSITLKQNKTPCHECAAKLIAFKEKYGVVLRIKAMIQYKGKNKEEREATQGLVQNGIPIIPYNIPEKLAKKNYNITRTGQFHELKNVRFDEKELTENHDESYKALVKKVIQQYRDSFNAKSMELASVVVPVLAKSGETDVAAVLEKAYHNQENRLTKKEFEEFKKRFLIIFPQITS
jgi:hypothetical protein